jgi:signal transduction histidine kinase
MPNGLLSVLLLTLMLTTFSSLVAADLSRQRFWVGFLAFGGVWSLAIIALSQFIPTSIGQSGWIASSIRQINTPALVMLIGFSIISLGILILAFYSFYVTPLPEVSNRALFWVFNITLILTGYALSVSGTRLLIVLGLSALTVGLAATTYSQMSYRVFDTRNVLGMAIRFLLLITLTAGALFGALVLMNQIELNEVTGDVAERTVLAGVLAITIAVLYTPISEIANWAINHMLLGRTIDPIEATKRYSHEMSKAIEINDLVEIAAKTLNAVLRVRRSGVILVSDTGTNYIELAVARGGSLTEVADQKLKVQTTSPIYHQLVSRQAPLSQFDIEFNPDYRTITDEERTFFRKLQMSAYAPIIMDQALIGLLTAGAKANDAPIFQRDLELLVALSNQTGVALRNTRLVADLRHLNNSMTRLNSNLGDTNERMSKLDSVKTDFVTIASHELRTPLAQVRGYTDIIDALNDQGMLDQDQTRGLVNNLRKATERMEELIAAMLDVSQLDVNAMDLRFSQTSPESVLRMAIEPLTDPIKQRKLTLSARGLRGLPNIEADMQRLVQAFRNVITNAIKFTPDGGRIDITANFHQAAKTEEDHILIAIQDTGIGIDKSEQELIFSKFYRASDPGLHSTGTYKFMGAGPGLGLTIARGVIEGHGGRIWAESPGQNAESYPGSTFYIRLPLHPPENARRVMPFEGGATNPTFNPSSPRSGRTRRTTEVKPPNFNRPLN